MSGELLNVRRAAWRAIAMLLIAAGSAAAEEDQPVARWERISDVVVKQLATDGIKTDWPGETAGVAVDPASGDVYMIVAGQGAWKSSDAGKTFARCDEKKVGGRCETSYALNFDPAGKRLACFMLDGKCAWTGDSGETWHNFADVGRNWDFAAVDWSTPEVQNIFAGLHESGGQVMFSSDGGQKWERRFKDAEFDRTGGLGIFDAKTLVYTQKGKGIQRSTDAGKTWTKVADAEPIGRVVQVHKGVAYWLASDGLLVSRDQGATWKLQGHAAGGTIGPMIDPKNDKRFVVAGVKGIFQTSDAGATWSCVADALPPEFTMPKAGWYATVAWDPVHDVFYASQMGKPTYRLTVAK